MTLPNTVIRNDPSTGKKIPAIVYNGVQYNDVEIRWKNGNISHVKGIERSPQIGSWPIPADFDVVELVSDTEHLEFRFHLKYGSGMRAGVEQAISSFSIPMREIDK